MRQQEAGAWLVPECGGKVRHAEAARSFRALVSGEAEIRLLREQKQVLPVTECAKHLFLRRESIRDKSGILPEADTADSPARRGCHGLKITGFYLYLMVK